MKKGILIAAICIVTSFQAMADPVATTSLITNSAIFETAEIGAKVAHQGKKGESVTVIKEILPDDDGSYWCKVTYGGAGTGYIRKNWLKEYEPNYLTLDKNSVKVEVSDYSDLVKYYATIENNSADTTYEFVRVRVEIYGKDHEMLTYDTSYAVGSDGIGPDERKQFDMFVTVNDAKHTAKGYKAKIVDYGVE